MCLEDRQFFSACAHANQGSVTRCPEFLVGPSCPKHMVHLEIHCSFCLTCSMQLKTHVPATPLLRCLDGLWSWHSKATGRYDGSKPGLGKLLPQDAVKDDVDFDASRDWLATLESAVAGCEPKVVRMGLDVWNDNPWLATDEAASRVPSIARQAQLRTIRWAAEVNLDNDGASEPGDVPIQAEEELDQDGSGASGEVLLDEASSVKAEAALDRDSNGESVSASESDQGSIWAPGGVVKQGSIWIPGGYANQGTIWAANWQGSIRPAGGHVNQNIDQASGGHVNQNSNWASGGVNQEVDRHWASGERRLRHGWHS